MSEAKKKTTEGSIWRKYCHTTDLHGFNHLILSSNVAEALFWLTVIVFCLVEATQQLTVLLKAYIMPAEFWSSRIYENSSSIDEPLPSVTICNANYMRASQLRAFNVNDNVRDYILQRTRSTQVFPIDDSNAGSSSGYSQWRHSVMRDRTLPEILQLLAHTCEETLLSVWMRNVIALGSENHRLWANKLFR